MFPKPVAGQVIRYSYLWKSEYLQGQEEGLKDRPCAIILVVTNAENVERVTVLPITHTPPSRPEFAVEIPTLTKRRLGLDDARSWVMLTEANRFDWPGPDLRPAVRGQASSTVYGELPGKLLIGIRDAFVKLHQTKGTIVPRSA